MPLFGTKETKPKKLRKLTLKTEEILCQYIKFSIWLDFHYPVIQKNQRYYKYNFISDSKNEVRRRLSVVLMSTNIV
jgi:hypothetical protein